MSEITRRKFLTAAAGLFATAAGRLLIGQLGTTGIGTTLVQSEFAAMGTIVSIKALHADPVRAEQAVAAAAAVAQQIDALMSIYRVDSQVSQLNRDGSLENPHPLLYEVLTAAQTMSRQSGGAFDVTVQPLWELYFRDPHPTEDSLSAVRALVDWRKLHVTRERVWFDTPGMKLTLNGIAQGFVTDCMMMELQTAGIVDALVDGGEIGAMGENSVGNPWRIGIQNPRSAQVLIGKLTMTRGFAATSGDYQTAFTPDYRQHHIFDPQTGVSPSELASITVIAPSAMLADSLSTAAFVLGVERGLVLVENHTGCAAYCVRKDGSSVKSAGFPELTF